MGLVHPGVGPKASRWQPDQWSTLHSVGTAIRGKHITRILHNGNSDGLNQRRPQRRKIKSSIIFQEEEEMSDVLGRDGLRSISWKMFALLGVLVILITNVGDNKAVNLNGFEVGKAASAVLSENPKLGGLTEDFLMKEENLPMWRQVIEAVMNETDSLDDIIFQEHDEEEEDTDDELQNRFGIGKDDKVDCYGLPDAISKLLRFLFQKDTTVNTKFLLSTRNQPNPVELTSDVNGTDFDPRRRTIFIVHGFMSNGRMQWVKDMVAALLPRVDANVFAVDWSEGGNSWMYWKAVANTRVAGEEMCTFIRKLMEIGLDPAQPCFQENVREIRLDPSDAQFIDIIHTNGRSLEKLGLGLPEPIGHVDFYPNGGAKQPGCSRKSRSVLFPIYNSIKNRIEKSICSHGRSYMFFIESVKTADRCSFWGHHWNRTDTEGDSALNSPCNASNCTEMGLEADIFPARGSFYVPTRDRTPYC
ncbi:hypothetical protein L9F63_022658, partial [Diploptera punctata]